ncbi:hypothetical protein [Photobacterium angustum]|uniref:Uncharacterized protein n=1 Tax=Photobacterium angustum TaxID=661 RepID=A0A855SC85_PHOAN|nr:hypothetical protein [Photobacterium angustum]KJF81567.1 hypothetical protein UB36_11005 [Photobacterium damselae subsp. damselae]KJG40820.1 hypothetical protein UA35_11655 [Photobacterium angustum]KJG45213.1 hypothetical protein UA31_11010 [Photobacterium angustum]KJG48728.1 hypothetical protein UA30_11430 [Photobacterium angustum]KJG52445.1 hypothetical protein UA34_13040 [Photobacterium angustum]
MKEQFKYIGDEIKQRYMKILSNYYPAHGSTGFTERNLTNNLVLAFERVLGESCISWFEAPICLNNGKHIDAVIFFESITILIESKRLTSVKSKLVSIANDVERMFSQKTIELVEKNLTCKSSIRTRYSIVLCDLWTESNEKFQAYDLWPNQLPQKHLRHLTYFQKISFEDLKVEGQWKNHYKILLAISEIKI